jgi:TetR/AcrR family transcriptional regulator
MSESQKRTVIRKRKEQAVRRKAILDAAREAFFEKGFMAATMNGIADRCDLAKGTIYLYFRSKEELYISLMAEGLSLLKNDLDGIGGLRLPADKLLGEMLKTYYAFYEKNRKYFRIMFLSSQPDVRERVRDDLLRECLDCAMECMQILNDVIQAGVDDGIFRKVNPWAFANVLWSMVNGIIMHYEQDPLYRDEILRLPLHEILQEALDLALNGLLVSV